MVHSGLVPAVGGIAQANTTALPHVRGFPARRVLRRFCSRRRLRHPHCLSPLGSSGSWFPGSARRLCSRIEGGTTAYVTNVTLRSSLRPVMEPPQLSKRGVEYDNHVPEPQDLPSPPIALNWVCFLSGSILRGFHPA